MPNELRIEIRSRQIFYHSEAEHASLARGAREREPAMLTAYANFCFTDCVPIYEYECSKGHRFEAIQKVDDPPLRKCEKCKAKAERLISSPAIQFKGSGWYVTDYAKKGTGGGEGKADSSKSKTSDKATTKKPD